MSPEIHLPETSSHVAYQMVLVPAGRSDSTIEKSVRAKQVGLINHGSMTDGAHNSPWAVAPRLTEARACSHVLVEVT
jgi:hypothetical protein